MGHASAVGRARLIWAIIAGGVAISLTLFFTAIRTLPAPSHHLSWFVAVGLFAVAEVAVTQVAVGTQRHMLSLVEVPLVLGLLTIQPKLLVAAWLLGGAVALGVVRRQTPIKLAYNLTGFALESLVAILVFHAISNGRNLLAATTFVAIIAATFASSVVTLLSVFTAVRLTEGEQPGNDLVRHASFGIASTLVTSSTMVVGVVLHQTDPPAMWLLAMPIAGVFLAQRAFNQQIRQDRRMQFLRHSTEMVAGLGTEEAVSSLLRQICNILRTEVAALTYLPVDVRDALALAVYGPHDEEKEVTLVPLDDHWDAWAALVPGRDPRIVSDAVNAAVLGGLIGHPGLRQAMIVPLCGDFNVIGYLTVADRLGDMSPFSADDLDSLDALERLVSMGLENGHLERSLQEAQVLERQLVHRATHDSLTGLANRTLLADHLARLLGESESDGTDIACLFIDLDDFKKVNDRFGHSIGDQLLVVTAQRLVGCLRDGDIAARFGGDELAVIAHVDPANNTAEANALGERIVASLARTASLGDHSVDTGASVGIVLGRKGSSAADMLAAADSAMYAAKGAGKGRVEVESPRRQPNRASR